MIISLINSGINLLLRSSDTHHELQCLCFESSQGPVLSFLLSIHCNTDFKHAPKYNNNLVPQYNNFLERCLTRFFDMASGINIHDIRHWCWLIRHWLVRLALIQKVLDHVEVRSQESEQAWTSQQMGQTISFLKSGNWWCVGHVCFPQMWQIIVLSSFKYGKICLYSPYTKS